MISFKNDMVDNTRLGHYTHYPQQRDQEDFGNIVNSGGVATDPFRSASHYLLQKEVKLLLCHFFLGAVLVSSLRRHLGIVADGGHPVDSVGSLTSIVFRFMMDTILLDCLLLEQRPDALLRSMERFLRLSFLMCFSLLSRKAIPSTIDVDESRSLWGSLFSILQFIFDMEG